MSNEKSIELLRCAIVNCDNSKKIPELIDLVKIQIEEALKLIENQPKITKEELYELNLHETRDAINDLIKLLENRGMEVTSE